MQFKFASLLAFTLGAIQVATQQVGQYETETHPSLPIQTCTKSGCTTVQTKIVLDSNWRWTHKVGDYKNCYDGNEWDTATCTSPEACAKNCAVEGVNYSGTYGITASGNSLSLRFVTKHQFGTNVGARVYLMANDEKYYMFKLLNKEFTFDVDVSKLPCGLNGALYFVQMDEDGGKSRFSGNKAGAKYGTGYCDAQCPHDMKWINGEANILDWQPSDLDANAGRGRYGTCCDEMDIWEANSMATAFTPHSCSTTKATRCEGSQCGDNGPDRYLGVCDKDGCDFNSYRMGDKEFYGKGKKVNTNQKMTVVTQFITDNGQASGTLKEIRRIYKQGGQVIQNSKVNIPGMDALDSVTTEFCDTAKSAFGDEPHFQTLGGMKKMGQSLALGHVLALSIWDDYYASMQWLDSAYPLDRDPSEPGIARGDCERGAGDPKKVEAESPNATVTFSNIKVGDLNTTY